MLPQLVRAGRQVPRERERAVRAAQELAETGIVVEEALHPGHTVPAQPTAVVARIIGAEMIAVVYFREGFLVRGRHVSVERIRMRGDGRDDVAFAGEDQHRLSYAAGES